MRKIIPVLIVSAITLVGMTDANACGDKTLRVGRGIRFQQLRMLASRHPSTILIYSPAIPNAKAPRLKAYFNEVGHKPHTVEDSAQLSEAVKSGQYDLVLTDIAEAANLRRQTESSASKTVVVPVVYKGIKAEETAARQYKTFVKNPTSGDDFLTIVYEVMKSKKG